MGKIRPFIEHQLDVKNWLCPWVKGSYNGLQSMCLANVQGCNWQRVPAAVLWNQSLCVHSGTLLTTTPHLGCVMCGQQTALWETREPFESWLWLRDTMVLLNLLKIRWKPRVLLPNSSLRIRLLSPSGSLLVFSSYLPTSSYTVFPWRDRYM